MALLCFKTTKARVSTPSFNIPLTLKPTVQIASQYQILPAGNDAYNGNLSCSCDNGDTSSPRCHLLEDLAGSRGYMHCTISAGEEWLTSGHYRCRSWD